MELIWRKLDGGQTQQAVADEIGWKRGDLSNYAALRKIDGEAWKLIATTVASGATGATSGGEEESERVVAFSERLLRSILGLTSAQQAALTSYRTK